MKALLLVLLAAAGLARAETVVLRDVAVGQPAGARATLVIRDGKLAAMGSNEAVPAGATVIEGAGKVVTPPLFGGLSHLGVEEVSLEAHTNDHAVRLGKMYPEFDLSLAYNPASSAVAVNRVDGIGWVLLAPSTEVPTATAAGGSIVAGQASVVALDGGPPKAPAAMMVDLGSDVNLLSGGSRAMQWALLRRALAEARAPRGATHEEDAMLTPAGRLTLADYLRKQRPFLFAVDRAADIRQVLAFARAEGIKPVIVGGIEAWRVARELAAARVAVLLNPFENLPKSFDRLGASLENAALLDRAGVRVGFISKSPSPHNHRRIRQAAGVAVANGLPADKALGALTTVPASLFGAGDVAALTPGREANLVLWSGDPFETSTVAERVWLGGREQAMRSRQSELRDRYLPKLKAGEAR